MKIIFLDFDGVMDTAYYDMVLVSKGLQEVDEYGVLFDPACVSNLETIIRNTTVQRNYPIGSVDLNRNHSSDVLV